MAPRGKLLIYAVEAQKTYVPFNVTWDQVLVYVYGDIFMFLRFL